MEDIRLVLITGLSGAGKTRAIQCFEDLGYFCVDNLPPTFIPKFAELCSQSGSKIRRIALVSDIRGGEFFSELFEALNELETMGLKYEILYLEADNETLIRRFKETRRRHPLAAQGSISEGLREERKLLEKVRGTADKIIDTTYLTPQQLREEIIAQFSQHKTEENILISLVSFGFKYGLPLDADLVLDVRFLPNPHYVPSLRAKTGLDREVEEYVDRWVITRKFLDKVEDLLAFLLPCYTKEGKAQLVVAVGCTGGQHRSVVISNKLAPYLKNLGYQVVIEHRDIGKI
ncbi:MAG TPA: RNase adapter RapZ [Firmicutes bacterium]|nr:RNase adapter RapZ [Bacillota bacterium]